MNLTATFFFTMSAIIAYRLFGQEPWLYQPNTWLHDRNHVHVDQTVTAAIKCYYLLYAARFVSDTISLPFEVGRTTTTFLVALVHHGVTLSLIASAIYGHYIRGAAVIMFFFDWADPPLLLAKVCKYLHDALMVDEMVLYQEDGTTTTAAQKKTTRTTIILSWFANRLFEIFAIVFFISRNGLYSFVTYTFWRTLPPEAITERTTLILLMALQTYWAILIVQAATRRQESGGTVQDVREEDKQKKM
jgi:hypothetical protein